MENKSSSEVKKTASESNLDGQYAAAYLKHGISHGITYQVKLLTWVTWKLLCKSDANVNNWHLGTEVRNARGFHDLVLKYQIDDNSTESGNSTYMYRFVQIKHKLCLKKGTKISINSLKSKQKKNQYSLIYLFNSYLNMIGMYEKITTDQIADMTVFTNVDVHKIDFLTEVNRDKIFDFEGKGKRYRINLDYLLKNKPAIIERLRKLTMNDLFVFDFLSKLVFAVDQPSEFELEQLITQEIGKVFNVPQIFYNDLYKKVIGWFLIYDAGKAPYLTEKQVVKYLQDAQKILSEAKKTEIYVSGVSQLPEMLSLLHI